MKEDTICMVLPFRKRIITLGEALSREKKRSRFYELKKPEYTPFYTKPKKRKNPKKKKKKNQKKKHNRNTRANLGTRLNKRKIEDDDEEEEQIETKELKKVKEDIVSHQKDVKMGDALAPPTHTSSDSSRESLLASPKKRLKELSKVKEEEEEEIDEQKNAMVDDDDEDDDDDDEDEEKKPVVRHPSIMDDFKRTSLSREARALARHTKRVGDVTKEELDLIARDNAQMGTPTSEKRPRSISEMMVDDDIEEVPAAPAATEEATTNVDKKNVKVELVDDVAAEEEGEDDDEDDEEDDEDDDDEDEEEEERLYCICRKPNDSSEFYIQCDRCYEWYHGKCVGVSEDESDKLGEYICPICINKDASSKAS